MERKLFLYENQNFFRDVACGTGYTPSRSRLINADNCFRINRFHRGQHAGRGPPARGAVSRFMHW